MITFLTATLAISTLFVLLVCAKPDETVTLYNVPLFTLTTVKLPNGAPSISGGFSYSYSPVGIGPDGRTTYDEISALTAEEVEQQSTTQTLSTPSPSPTTIALVEGADGMVQEYTAFNIFSRSCAFHGTSQAECVEVDLVTNAPSSTLIATTWTATLTPIYTLVESSGTQLRIPWIAIALSLVVTVIV